jgi:hypothetical protein
MQRDASHEVTVYYSVSRSMQRDASHEVTVYYYTVSRSMQSQHNSAPREACWYCSSDLDLCSSGNNVAPNGESKSFTIRSLGISYLHFLSLSFPKMLFLIPKQPCLSFVNILEVPISSSYRNGISQPALTFELTENESDLNVSEPRPFRWLKFF